MADITQGFPQFSVPFYGGGTPLGNPLLPGAPPAGTLPLRVAPPAAPVATPLTNFLNAWGTLPPQNGGATGSWTPAAVAPPAPAPVTRMPGAPDPTVMARMTQLAASPEALGSAPVVPAAPVGPYDWNKNWLGPQAPVLGAPAAATPAPGPSGVPATSPLFEAALKAEGVTGAAADFARSTYRQESGSGTNTKTSNAGAVGGMQIIPTTFNAVADPGWSINDPTQNARAGIRYANQMFNAAGGDPVLAGAGYYGGPHGMALARQGVAVSDPRNPNAPNTLQYGAQVAAGAGANVGANAATNAATNAGPEASGRYPLLDLQAAISGVRDSTGGQSPLPLGGAPASPYSTPTGVPEGLVQMIKGMDSYYTRPDGSDVRLYHGGNGQLSEQNQQQRTEMLPALAGHQLQYQGTVDAARIRAAADIEAQREAQEGATTRQSTELYNTPVASGTAPNPVAPLGPVLTTYSARVPPGGMAAKFEQIGPTAPANAKGLGALGQYPADVQQKAAAIYQQLSSGAITRAQATTQLRAVGVKE